MSYYSLALNRIEGTVDQSIKFIEKISQEKSDLSYVVSRLRKDVRALRRNIVELVCEKNTAPNFLDSTINDIITCIDELEKTKEITSFWKMMMTRLLEDIKNKSISNYKYADYFCCYLDNEIYELSGLTELRCSSNRKLNIFFPNLDYGYRFIDRLDVFRERYNVYASAVEDRFYNRLKGHVDYRILGPLIGEGARISNAFDVVFIAPTIQTDMERKKDIEKISTLNLLKYIRPDGLCVIYLPYSRCSDDFLMLLSKRLRNISFIKANKDNMVYIVANKVEFKDKDESAEDYNYLIEQINKNICDLDTRIDFSKYSALAEEMPIETFRGSKISKEEMCDYCLGSGLIDDFIEESQTIEEVDTHPLLPFNIGQVGLVLTSSQLNGVVKDEKGVPHLIKGMTIKDTNKTEEREGDDIRSVEVVANRVQINILSADGKIIKIS